MILPPNILITNYCNQNCSFCFAREEMNDKDQNRNISITDFKTILKKIKNSGAQTIKLLGGEPTLHPRLVTLLKLSLQSFPSVQIFTNGIYSEKTSQMMAQFFPQIKITFNSMTPAFLLKPEMRKIVTQRIQEYAPKTQVTLSLTIDPFTKLDQFFKLIPDDVLQNVYNYRIGMSNPTAKDRNYYLFSDFPKIGKKLCGLVQLIKNKSPKATTSLNCGFARCMFTNEEFNYIKKNIFILGWSCFGKASSMDITTGMEAFHCFPLSPIHRLSIKNTPLKKTDGKFLLKRYEYWKKIQLNKCKNCPFYGYGEGKCPGPCVAFRMNAQHT